MRYLKRSVRTPNVRWNEYSPDELGESALCHPASSVIFAVSGLTGLFGGKRDTEDVAPHLLRRRPHVLSHVEHSVISWEPF